ncbi:hypothetical protein RSAG8_03205, partial [Rhizoctonia solani AG-8 WAC10335]
MLTDAWLETFPGIRLASLALNLPEDLFADKVKTAAAGMRLIHYSPQTEVVGN